MIPRPLSWKYKNSFLHITTRVWVNFHIHISPVNQVSIGSDNGLSPIRLEAVIWTSAGLLSIGPVGRNFSEILTKIQNFSVTKIHLKIPFAKWRPFYAGGNEFTLHISFSVQTRVKVSRIISHPGWESSGYKGFPNDIAVIELASSAQTSSAYIGTVSLASSGQNFEGSTCYITGWGRLSGNSGSPNILQEAQVDVYSQVRCHVMVGLAALQVTDNIVSYHKDVFIGNAFHITNLFREISRSNSRLFS